MIYGYARVSTTDQDLTRQLDELGAEGCDRIWSEHASGAKGAKRPEWDDMLSHLREGDTLAVVELSRLGRSTSQLAALADELKARGVSLRIRNLGVDTSTVSGKLTYDILAAVASAEREILIERVQSGLASARRKGRTGGRKPKYGTAEVERIKKLRENTALSMPEIASAAGCSVSTAYRLLAESEK